MYFRFPRLRRPGKPILYPPLYSEIIDFPGVFNFSWNYLKLLIFDTPSPPTPLSRWAGEGQPEHSDGGGEGSRQSVNTAPAPDLLRAGELLDRLPGIWNVATDEERT